jgi:hypothetical protein
MKAIPLAAVLVLAAGAAGAQTRPSTTSLACNQARGLVQAQGAVVLGTGGQTFDRFVNHSGFCAREEIAEQSFAPTLDNRQCPVGFRCVLRDVEISSN